MKNYYNILEISYSASYVEIREAYINKKFNDRDSDIGELSSLLQKDSIEEAYNILINPYRRKLYNIQLIQSDIQRIQENGEKISMADPNQLEIPFPSLKSISEIKVSILNFFGLYSRL